MRAAVAWSCFFWAAFSSSVGGAGVVGVDLSGASSLLCLKTWTSIHGGLGGVGGVGAFAVGELLDHSAVGEEGQGLLGLHVEGGVVVEAFGEGWVGDGVGVELLLEPLVGALGEDLFEVAGAGAEGEAVEELEGSFAVVEGDEGGWFGWLGGFLCGGPGWRGGLGGGSQGGGEDE